MAPMVNRTRLAHFLEGYQPLGEDLHARIWDRVYRAGWSSDDPMSLQIAHDVILEHRLLSFGRAMSALPGQLDAAVQSALDTVEATRTQAATADRQAIAAQVAREATCALQTALPRFEKVILRRTAQRLLLMLVLFSLLAGIGGYIWGRHDTGEFENEFAALAERADAKTWIRMQELNGNLDVILSDVCSPHGSGFFMTAEGKPACYVPLWLEVPSMSPPGPETAMDFATDHLSSWRSRSSFFVILAIGAMLGAVLQRLLHRLRRWVIQE